MEQLGVQKVYIDKVSGKNKDREQLQKMLSFIRSGDCLIVESISRFASNVKDLLELIEILQEKGVEFVSKKENTDTTTPSGRFMLTVFAAVSELERGYILDRQKEGIAIAKSESKYKGRKPIEVDEDLWNRLYHKWNNGEITAAEFMRQVKLKPNTFYRRINT